MTALRHGPNGRSGVSPERRLPTSPDVPGGASATSAASAFDQLNLIDYADARRGT
jgi:hypothetical protein